MRIAIIADIHEDIINLQIALSKIERLQCDEIVCLGDISGFNVSHHDYFDSRNASECLKLVKENCSVIIAGNHDLHAAGRTPEISSFKYPSGWYELDFHERLSKSGGEVWLYEHEELSALYTRDEINFVSKLPEYQLITYEETPVLFTHFIIPNLTGSGQKFYFEATEFEEHKQFMAEKEATYSFSGHRHYPGLMAVSSFRVITRGFGRKYKLKPNDSVLVPPITRAQGNSGFCIYDATTNTAEAIRI